MAQETVPGDGNGGGGPFLPRESFLTDYYEHVSREDIAGYSLDILRQRALYHLSGAAEPAPGQAAVGVLNDPDATVVVGDLLRAASPSVTDEAIGEYWKGYDGTYRRDAHLALYRSGEFSELAAYEGALAAMEVPTLLLWGEDDAFAPVAGAYRFKREIPHAELVVLEGVGHFLQEDAPDRVAAELARFLGTVGSGVR
jgi:pimeloyl-ACP methyl ester carboxylesterase